MIWIWTFFFNAKRSKPEDWTLPKGMPGRVITQGTVAIAAQAPIDVDPATLKITNHPDADRLLQSRYEYRKEFFPG